MPAPQAQVTWSELLEALYFAETCFTRWGNEGALTAPQLAAITSFYAVCRETQTKAAAAGGLAPADFGLPPARPQQSPTARALRHWAFVDAEILRHHAANRLGLAQVHQFRGEVRERTARRRLELEEIPEVQPLEEAPAAAFRAGAVVTRTTQRPLSVANFFGAAVAVMVAAVAALAVLGLTEWQQHAPWLMLVPFAYLVAARATRGRPEETAFASVAHATALVMLVSSLASTVRGFTQIVEKEPLNLVPALFFAEAAAFYALASAWRRHPVTMHLCAAAACAAVWQILTYFGVPAEAYTLTFALVGLGLVAAYRFATLDRFAAGGLARTAFEGGNTLLSLALLAGLFMGAARVASQQMHPAQDIITFQFVAVSLALVAVTLVAIGLVRAADWRRWYVVMTVCQALVILLALQLLSHLSVYQKLEIFSVIVGLALLVLGHVGWYREQDRQSDLVSVSLFLGSLLGGLPLAIATLVDRAREHADPLHDHLILLNELGFLAVSVLLLASGFVLQLKSTTLIGAGLTVLYFVTLLVYVPWGRLNTVAILITAGGGVIFGTGLVLSLYRDRLLALPERIQKREGVFRVLSWR